MFFFFLLFWSFNTYSVEPAWLGKTKFNGDSSGVVRAIIAQDNHLYLGAENGFLDLVGETSTLYSPENSVLSDGYINRGGGAIFNKSMIHSIKRIFRCAEFSTH